MSANAHRHPKDARSLVRTRTCRGGRVDDTKAVCLVSYQPSNAVEVQSVLVSGKVGSYRVCKIGFRATRRVPFDWQKCVGLRKSEERRHGGRAVGTPASQCDLRILPVYPKHRPLHCWPTRRGTNHLLRPHVPDSAPAGGSVSQVDTRDQNKAVGHLGRPDWEVRTRARLLSCVSPLG